MADSTVGVGVDYATGVRTTGDRTLSGVFGASSTAVLDLETLRSPIRRVGPSDVLSTRNVVTHLLTPDAHGTSTTYDLVTRRVSVGRSVVKAPQPKPWKAPTIRGAKGVVYLGGDVLGEETTAVLDEFVAQARAATHTPSRARIVVIGLDAADEGALDDYAAALTAAGWWGAREDRIDPRMAGTRGATAVVVVGEDRRSSAPR